MDTSEFLLEGPSMIKSKSKRGNRYTPEFKQQMVELVRAGRAPKQLGREFGCSYWAIQSWIKRGDRDAGRSNVSMMVSMFSHSGRRSLLGR